ncbi:MAG: branched-chain amino acid transport system permease protein [Chloroflexota bacterium]|jgi:branched-chain amino acid transport system permease protein|nr:branched-chain amino acid transport system permease protein [Chloroflexota bacterium]
MAEVLQQLVNAVSLGAVYALMALGLALVYSVLGLINFAHGELMTIAAYTLVFSSAAHVPLAIGLALAIGASVVAAVLMERIVFRPVRGSGPMTLLLTSVAISIMIQTAFQMLISPLPRGADLPDFLYQAFDLGPVRLGVLPLISATTAIAGSWIVVKALRATNIGISIRASAENFTITRLLGVPAQRVVIWTFVLSGAVAGLAGVIWMAQRGSVDPLMGSTPLLKAFVATVLGGLGSVPGAILGGFALGAAEIVLQAFLPPELLPFRDAIVFALVIAVLTVRPRGLLPAKLGERV